MGGGSTHHLDIQANRRLGSARMVVLSHEYIIMSSLIDTSVTIAIMTTNVTSGLLLSLSLPRLSVITNTLALVLHIPWCLPKIFKCALFGIYFNYQSSWHLQVCSFNSHSEHDNSSNNNENSAVATIMTIVAVGNNYNCLRAIHIMLQVSDVCRSCRNSNCSGRGCCC